jgi:hypothetical protein
MNDGSTDKYKKKTIWKEYFMLAWINKFWRSYLSKHQKNREKNIYNSTKRYVYMVYMAKKKQMHTYQQSIDKYYEPQGFYAGKNTNI